MLECAEFGAFLNRTYVNVPDPTRELDALCAQIPLLLPFVNGVEDVLRTVQRLLVQMDHPVALVAQAPRIAGQHALPWTRAYCRCGGYGHRCVGALFVTRRPVRVCASCGEEALCGCSGRTCSSCKWMD